MAYTATKATECGRQVVVLEGNGNRMAIAPELGANWFSWQVDGQELFAKSDLASGRLTGTPVLFPTPNRVWNAAYKWNGKIIHQRVDGKPLVLHGLVQRAPFAVEAMCADEEHAEATFSIAITDGERLESFPFPCKLTLTFRLTAAGVGLSYRVDNLGEEEMAFGFAIHPFFGLIDDRQDIYIQVPAPYIHETSLELFPTGKVFPVDGTKFDLREFRKVEGLVLDDVFYGMSGKTAAIQWRKSGRGVTLDASQEFTHMVVYTPESSPVICLENQTCSTDAFNRHEAGYKETAHLITVEPGQAHEGWISLRHHYL